MRLVLIIVISLISISTLLAQDDSSKVNQNKEKIGELNQRLDKLLEGSKTIDGDSVEQKLRMLFEEIKSIKSSLTELKESVGQLSEELNDVKSLEEKITTIEHGKYYLVLASIRDKSRAAKYGLCRTHSTLSTARGTGRAHCSTRHRGTART